MGLPIPNLDDKTFDEILEEARTLIPLYSEMWTDHNIHDPGVTFIELFSWLAETYLYQLNRITDVQYQKMLELVDGAPYDVQPSRVALTFQEIDIKKVLSKGTEVFTNHGVETVVFQTTRDLILQSTNLIKIETIYKDRVIDQSKANNQPNISFHPFGKDAIKESTLVLGFDKALDPNESTIYFDLVEDDSPQTLYAKDQDGKTVSPILSVTLIWEYWAVGDKWKVLPVNEDSTFSLYKSGYITFETPDDMAMKDASYQIRSRIEKGGYEIVPVINTILINTVEAVQIETIKDEPLGFGTGNPGQKIYLEKTPVIRGSQTISIKNSDQNWEERDNFDLSGPDDPHYIFDNERGEIIFGNGLNGCIPDNSQELTAIYQTTMGAGGNIPAGKIFGIENSQLTATNLKKSYGGEDAESIDNAILRAKKAFRTVHRAITTKDIETLACQTPGIRVAKAKAIPNHSIEFPCISMPDSTTVVVIPYVRKDTTLPIPSEAFVKNVYNYLQTKRLITSKIDVRAPEFVKVSVTCKVHIKRRQSAIAVQSRVDQALQKFLDPRYYSEEEKGWPLGRDLFLSEVYQTIDDVEGVDYVRDVTIDAKGYTQEYDRVSLPAFSVVYSSEHQIEVIES